MPGDSEQPVTIKTEISAFKRLPSFRTPRDLKLSEFRDIRPTLLNENRNKRVFVPNLNVQRKKTTEANKDASPANNDSAKQTQRDRGKREERVRGGRRRPNFIQSAGVFSEGLAPTLKHWRSRQSNESSSSSIPRPKLNLKESSKVNKQEEEEVMKELFKDDFIEDPDAQPDMMHCPVKLPLQDCKEFIAKCKVEDVPLKEESLEKDLNGFEVKEEPDILNDMAVMNGFKEMCTADLKPAKAMVKEEEIKPLSLASMKPLTISQLLSKSYDKTFLFFQIPSCLPSMKVNVESASKNAKPDSQKNEEEESEKCVLRNLPPGRIGKLQILKSGKARLILGDVKLWVESGTQTAFKQDLISVNLDANQKTGQMINLGDFTTRLVISPDWESLLLNHRNG